MTDESLLLDAFIKNDDVSFQYLINTKIYSQEILQEFYNYSVKEKRWLFLNIYQKMSYKFHYLLTFEQYNIEEAIMLNRKTNFRHSYYIFEYLLEIKASAPYLKMFMSYHDSYFIYKLLRIIELNLENLIHLINELPYEMYHYQMELFTVLKNNLLTINQSNYLTEYIRRLINFYDLDLVTRYVKSVVEGHNISPKLLNSLAINGIRINDFNDMFSNLQLK